MYIYREREMEKVEGHKKVETTYIFKVIDNLLISLVDISLGGYLYPDRYLISTT
jgi:hypothetical protein